MKKVIQEVWLFLPVVLLLGIWISRPVAPAQAHEIDATQSPKTVTGSVAGGASCVNSITINGKRITGDVVIDGGSSDWWINTYTEEKTGVTHIVVMPLPHSGS